MDFIRSHKLIVATIVIQIIALPLILLAVSQSQDTETSAYRSSTMFFNPPSSTEYPIQLLAGENFSLDLMLDPGTELVSQAKIEILYDPAKLELSTTNPVMVNNTAFPVTVEDTIITQGKVQIVVSVGSDLTKAIQSETNVLTLNFKGIDEAPQTEVSFGTTTQLVAISNDGSSNENILSNNIPANVKINIAPASTTPGR